MKFPVYHVLGCGEIAFSFLQEPHEGMLMDPSLQPGLVVLRE